MNNKYGIVFLFLILVPGIIVAKDKKHHCYPSDAVATRCCLGEYCYQDGQAIPGWNCPLDEYRSAKECYESTFEM